MNKKLALLLIPLMLMPLAGFAYAHWTDRVTKQIKLHAGTVEVDIVRWHIDECNSVDVDCDDLIYGDELKVEMLTENGQVVEIYITADPVFPGWKLWFKMLIHNKGRLTVASDIHNWGWIGPVDDDPCWLDAGYGEYPNDQTVPSWTDDAGVSHDILEYIEELYLHDYVTNPECKGILCTDFDHYTVPTYETTSVLKPSQCLLLSERIVFNAQTPEGIAEAVQCHWFRLAKELGFKQYIPDAPWDSEGWIKPVG